MSAELRLCGGGCCQEAYRFHAAIVMSLEDIFTYFCVCHLGNCMGAYRSWKVVEFKIQIFQAWKVVELGVGPGKSWIVMENKPNGCRISDLCIVI